MNRLGFHIALTEDEVAHLRELLDDQARLESVQQDLEESSFEHSDLIVETYEAWVALHRVLDEGERSSERRGYPLSHVMFGGESLCTDSESTLSLKTPDQVRDIATALAGITEVDFRQRFSAIDWKSQGNPPIEGDFGSAWESLQDIKFVYTQAAEKGLNVLFTLITPEADTEQPNYPSIFRDYGILPSSRRAPDGVVRCYLSGPRILFEYTMTVLISLLGIVLLFYIPSLLPEPLNWLGGAATLLGFIAMLDLGTRSVYRWVELDGTTLRSKRLLTGRITERDIADIISVDSLILKIRQAETLVIEAILGRVQGVDIHFRDSRKPLRIRRVDPAMHNAEPMIETLLYRMQQIGELETEFVTLEGTPLVGRVTWKKNKPGKSSDRSFNLSCACVTILAGLSFGMPLGCTGRQRLEHEAVRSIPPHELTLATLIQQGPGNNRHITITDYQPGEHVSESKNGTWTNVWVPLFPAKVGANEIQVVWKSDTIRDAAELNQLLQPGRLTGICSEEPRIRWGMSLGPKLVEANQNRPISSAWEIEDTREPTSAKNVMIASCVMFSIVLLCAFYIFRVRS